MSVVDFHNLLVEVFDYLLLLQLLFINKRKLHISTNLSQMKLRKLKRTLRMASFPSMRRWNSSGEFWVEMRTREREGERGEMKPWRYPVSLN